MFIGNVVFVCEKPVSSWQNGILHSDNSPAIKWKDGTGLYFLNGVSFDKELFEKVTSRKMPFEEILAIKDIDQRKQAMKFGEIWEFVKFGNAKELDTYTKKGAKDGRKIRYWLYEFPKNRDLFPNGATYAIYEDSMLGGAELHMQGIHPSVNAKTVPEAMSWKQSDDLFTLSPQEWEALELDVHFT